MFANLLGLFKKPKAVETVNTVIGKGVEIGNSLIGGPGNIIVMGALKCDVNMEMGIHVEQSGIIHGNISGYSLVVSGVVVGNVAARNGVTVKASGSLSGELACSSLRVEDGGIFKGKCKVEKNKEFRTETSENSLNAQRAVLSKNVNNINENEVSVYSS